MKKPHVAFIPCPGAGHLFPAVEFAKSLVDHDDHLYITFFIMVFPFGTPVPSFSSSERIKFVNLTLEESVSEGLMSKAPGTRFEELVELNKPRVRNTLSSEGDRVSAFILDMFCTSFVNLANEFSVPTYVYFTSSAGFLGLILQLQVIDDECSQELEKLKHSDSELNVPAFSNLVPAKVLPPVLIDKGLGFPNFLDMPRTLRETKGILVNTFTELEPYAIKSLMDDDKVPQIYPVGPVIKKHRNCDKFETGMEKIGQDVDIKNWLDNQPLSSVLLLSFGSRGSFEKKQVLEIANALERSGTRFLWALRRPPLKGKTQVPTEYEDLNDVLPEGFLDRTSTVGKVLGWVPQVAALSHPAVGGFISHCGWNSTLESLYYGVPMATWPLYAEQKINAFELVKELGLAVEITMDYSEDQIVTSDEIEIGIRRLMNDRDCNTIREKVMEIAKKGKAALEKGGSSQNAMGCFIEDLICNYG